MLEHVILLQWNPNWFFRMVLAIEDVLEASTFFSVAEIQRTHYDVCFTLCCAMLNLFILFIPHNFSDFYVTNRRSFLLKKLCSHRPECDELRTERSKYEKTCYA